MILLWALLTAVFAPTFAYAAQAPERMVYCPLSKKFQPVRPPEEKKKIKPFDNICASLAKKDFLVQEIIIKNPFRFSLDVNRLDNLAFDFLAHGKSALKALPDAPNFPSPKISKQIASSVATGNNYEHKIFWSNAFQYSSPTLLARPPTAAASAPFALNSIHQSPEISRHLAPRAPPVRS